MLRPSRAALWRFAVLMFLSVVVASVGLLQDSAAVVVGAMVIAPLMAPIMGMAVSLIMGWERRLLLGAATVAAGVVGAVGLAVAIAMFLPDASASLPSEVLARTDPDIRDLLVALAAGAAGAYAIVRRDVSGALPGVAVAVALVPPLACVGILLGRGQIELARGAALLFAANLFGIVLAAAVVFLLTGFVPPRRLRTERPRALGVVAAVLVPTLVLGATLTGRFVHAADDARELRLATEAVQSWLDPRDDLDRIMLTGGGVRVEVRGEGAAPSVTALTGLLRQRLGHDTTVDLRWTPTSNGETASRADSAPLPLDRIRPVIEKWLADQSLILDGLSYDGSTLVVQTSGSSAPGDAAELDALLDDRFSSHPPISFAWTETSTNASPTAEPDTTAQAARAAAESWAEDHPEIGVLAVDQTGLTVTVTIIGAAQPPIGDLRAALSAALPQAQITVQWVAGAILGHLAPSPVPSLSPDTELRSSPGR
ncbi:TIGR00341 family protein [Frankia sp. CcI49]|uniref:TIGR00341 family protein n=1 Tax=Frankia sp. CcI49 TaxID=1745382 RepID=UPI000976A2CE|nr:TIGR00341 family protein [Frankia sp. CcI49]ONH55414.1 TIGR00341 family protein [Frankia sp. CcI49]